MNIDCYELFKWLPISKGWDKICHISIGFIIGFILTIVFSQLWGSIAFIILGVGKELYDKYIKKTEFDFFDMFGTMAGGFMGVLIALLIKTALGY